jgi:hypothetical protein
VQSSWRRPCAKSHLWLSRTALKSVSAQAGRSMAQVALAWLRHQAVPVIPMIGARKVSQLRDNLASLDLELANEQLEALDGASRIELGFPRGLYQKKWFVQSGMAACGIACWFSATVSGWVWLSGQHTQKDFIRRRFRVLSICSSDGLWDSNSVRAGFRADAVGQLRGKPQAARGAYVQGPSFN